MSTPVSGVAIRAKMVPTAFVPLALNDGNMPPTKRKNLARLGIAHAVAATVMVWFAPAQANIVWNGNFDSGAVGWGTGSSQHNLAGTTIGGQTAIGASNTLLSNEYQIVDAAHNNDGAQYTQYNNAMQGQFPSMPTNENGTPTGWVAGSASETYNFSFQYYIGKGSATIQLLDYTAAGPVPYNVNTATYNQMPGGAGWNQLYSQTFTSTSPTGWITIDVPMGTISGSPEYFAIILTKGSGTGTSAYFDSISLDVNTPSVPEPTTIVLFGAGLLGIGAVRNRRAAAA